jgi:hypothetical protein
MMVTSLPGDVYGRPEVFERERREIFAREWLLVAARRSAPSSS